jgi:hypothetical protein
MRSATSRGICDMAEKSSSSFWFAVGILIGVVEAIDKSEVGVGLAQMCDSGGLGLSCSTVAQVASNGFLRGITILFVELLQALWKLQPRDGGQTPAVRRASVLGTSLLTDSDVGIVAQVDFPVHRTPFARRWEDGHAAVAVRDDTVEVFVRVEVALEVFGCV